MASLAQLSGMECLDSAVAMLEKRFGIVEAEDLVLSDRRLIEMEECEEIILAAEREMYPLQNEENNSSYRDWLEEFEGVPN